MQHLIVIQHFTITYGKAHRGGEYAQQRSALPQVAAMPALTPQPDTRFVYQQLSFHAASGFRVYRQVTQHQQWPKILERVLRIEETGSGAQVYFYPRERGTAAPPCPLSVGQWCQARWNVRQTYESTWVYEEHTFNVALLPPEDPSGEPFLWQPPQHKVIELVRLY